MPIMENALGSWATRDPEAASAWLAAQEPSDSLDAAITGMLEVARLEDPDASIQWANTIGQTDKRVQQLAKILNEQPRSWSRAAVGDLQLEAAEQERLSRALRFSIPTPNQTP